MNLNIEFLYFRGCPNHEAARRLLVEVLRENRIKVTLHNMRIASRDHASERPPSITTATPMTSPISSVNVKPNQRLTRKSGFTRLILSHHGHLARDRRFRGDQPIQINAAGEAVGAQRESMRARRQSLVQQHRPNLIAE